MRMKPLGSTRRSLVSGLLVVAVSPAAVLAQSSSQSPQLPDSPSAVVAGMAVETRMFPEQTSTSPGASEPPQSQPQSSVTQKPVGTAVAETPATTGFAASNPAGAAIAPAKQRRARTVFIRVGAILGAGVAVGTVAALASASPSKPPGSR
jgi:hypothetical protein